MSLGKTGSVFLIQGHKIIDMGIHLGEAETFIKESK